MGVNGFRTANHLARHQELKHPNPDMPFAYPSQLQKPPMPFTMEAPGQDLEATEEKMARCFENRVGNAHVPTRKESSKPGTTSEAPKSGGLQSISVQQDSGEGCGSAGHILETRRDTASIDNDTPTSTPTAQSSGSDTERGDTLDTNSDTTLGTPSTQSFRSPSPWQNTVNSLPGEERRINNHLSRSLAWLLESARSPENDDEGLPQPDAAASVERHSPDSSSISSLRSRFNSRGDSEEISSNTGSTSRGPPQCSPSRTQETTSGSSLERLRRSRDCLEGDGGDGSGSPPPFKQQKKTHHAPFIPQKRFRYACPYNKWDPRGCPLCCMRSTKNPDGGAETFPRVK